MSRLNYSVNQNQVDIILNWILSGEIAIPEIQRPFVWNSTKVRDFVDSLYRGYPVGYLIVWKNPNVRLKDGSISSGKKILVDGQQRVSALMAALLGKEIVDKDYRRKRIYIAFNPEKEIFEVADASIWKDKNWIPDIAEVFKKDFHILKFIKKYCDENEDIDEDDLSEKIESLKGIVNNSIGLIELNSDLDIDAVTDIFIRINSQGVELNQADFAMSKIAADELHNGNILRKAIDYFCHLAVEPSFYNQLNEVDREFTQTEYFDKMAWLKTEIDDLYDPSYSDLLRTVFTYKFKRGKLQVLVALLSGRNFETHTYEESIVEDSFRKLDDGIKTFMNESNFKKFLLILRSAGFVSPSLITSQNVVNFAYALYLTLKETNMNPAKIESLVRRWFVFSALTSRYSESPETHFDYDIRNITQGDPEEYIQKVIASELSESFWELTLPQQMVTSSANSPYFNVFLASQVKNNDKGFLSKDILVKDLIEVKGDVHHVFPREYLKQYGYSKGNYNQIANYVMVQNEINIEIGSKPPNVYLKEILEQCRDGKLKYGGIDSEKELMKNLEVHCIPTEIFDMDYSQYNDFLEKRRKLIAKKIQTYFSQL